MHRPITASVSCQRLNTYILPDKIKFAQNHQLLGNCHIQYPDPPVNGQCLFILPLWLHVFLQDTFYESDFEDDDDEENLKLPKIVSILCVTFSLLKLLFFFSIMYTHLF